MAALPSVIPAEARKARRAGILPRSRSSVAGSRIAAQAAPGMRGGDGRPETAYRRSASGSQPRGHTPIHGELGPGDEGAVVGGKEQGGTGHVLARAEAPERRLIVE